MEPKDGMDHVRGADVLTADWITLVLLLVFAALAYTNMSSPRKWKLLGQAIFQMRLGRQTLREEIDLQDRTFLGLLLVAVGVLSLFLWQAAHLLDPGGQANFLRVMGAVGLLLLAQSVVLRLVAMLAATDNGINEYRSTGLVLFILTGLVLLPLVVLISYYAPWRHALLPAGFLVLSALLLYRWVRGAWVGSGEGVPLRYIILYFCAAEIVPLLLLVHALRDPLTVASNP